MFDCSGTSGDYDANVAISFILKKNFRNRIAHHEAICFDSSGKKSILPAQDSYNLILRYVNYLGYTEANLFFGLDVLPDSVLERIDSL